MGEPSSSQQNKVIPLLSVAIETLEDGDLSINITPNDSATTILPANFMDFLCVQIGNFVTGAFHQLREVPKEENGLQSDAQTEGSK